MPDGICPFAQQIAGVTTFDHGFVDRVGFCDHAANGFFSRMCEVDFWLGQGTSVHFAISRNGEIAQFVNIFDTAFAQGRLGPTVAWPRFAEMSSRNPNGYLISTEHEDAIRVNGVTQFIPGSEWTPAQYDADLRLKRWCIEEVRRVQNKDIMRFGIDSLVGHHMFDGVDRADCPGRFWRDSYRARLFADLTGAPVAAAPATRIWLYGNEQAGEEVVGKQVWRWHLGVNTDRYGDEAGQFPGRRFHNEGGQFVMKDP